MSLFLPKLKYELDELEPFISARTMDFHYNKHFQNYINTANTLIQDTDFADKSLKEIVQTSIGPIFNNAAQAFNHEFYFNCLCPKGKAVQIPSALAEAINDNFGSLANFKEQFTKNAIGNFGSGWTWLVQNPVSRKLSIVNTGNAATPLTDGMSVLLCIDVWEHAYYLDYQNRRPEHLAALWQIIDWNAIEKRYSK